MSLTFQIMKFFIDITATIIFWLFFIFGFIFIFLPFYLDSLLFSPNRELSFQKINHNFYYAFFEIMSFLPGIEIRISDEVRSIQSSVIVCNHRSYFDPILLVSIYPRHKTIVKNAFFKVPIFGWFLKQSGYIPFIKPGEDITPMTEKIKSLDGFFSTGGILFIFPEGTRSKDNQLQVFKKGAFKIAQRLQAPIDVLYIKNTDAVFGRGRYLLNTCMNQIIEIKRLGRIKPNYNDDNFSINQLVQEVQQMYPSDRNS